MTRVSLFSSPYLLGFDDFERILDRAAKSANDGYPPYNIERVPRVEDAPEKFRITLAVAGFARDELEITVEDNQLIIRGRQVDDGSRAYLHRGIAARQFQRAFVVADGVEVKNAQLENGLLAIDLERLELQRIVRKIEIKGV
jgi:HSP20 family molecular chaperone IbpA